MIESERGLTEEGSKELLQIRKVPIAEIHFDPAPNVLQRVRELCMSDRTIMNKVLSLSLSSLSCLDLEEKMKLM